MMTNDEWGLRTLDGVGGLWSEWLYDDGDGADEGWSG